MNRREFGISAGGVTLGSMMNWPGNAQNRPEDWKSGQDSPVHDSDRLLPIGTRRIAIENEKVKIAFDENTGALVEFLYKTTGWQIQREEESGESFRIFAATPERSYNPVIGARNRPRSITKSEDGRCIKIVWDGVESEYSGHLDITFTGAVSLQDDEVRFELSGKNASQTTITSIEWPIIGALSVPKDSATLSKLTFPGNLPRSLYPRMDDGFGFCSVNYPTQMAGGRFNLFLAEKQGLYVGRHDKDERDVVRFFLELRPGLAETRTFQAPKGVKISGHPVRYLFSVQHFPFAAQGESFESAPVVTTPFLGDWHKGADVYRRWFFSWFKRPSQPGWLSNPHMWTQIQINGSEDDLRTQYKDLPRRAMDAAKNGISTIQLTGWNKGGQDRGNPSHDTDPRLGTKEELKDAIARIQKMGMRIVLFNKYCWADQTTNWYKQELHQYMATDPNGLIYTSPGFKYQTPEQLADINTRRFAIACVTDKRWLDLSAHEFQKSLDLGADGILYDENHHHGDWDYCFSRDHGHHSPASMWVGDQQMGQMFRDQIRRARGDDGSFLMGGEGTLDFQTQWYSLAYSRLIDEHVPIPRYCDPRREIMIAVCGFDDRDMVNCALRYRYIMSIEFFKFKGNASDGPLTMSYALKMENMRIKYREYLWDGEFRDNQDAVVTVDEKTYEQFSVFVSANGKRAAVVVNEGQEPINVALRFEGQQHPLVSATPEQMEAKPLSGGFQIPPDSVIVVMEA